MSSAIVYTPDEATVSRTRLAGYLRWLAERGQAPTHDPRDYAALHAWSVADETPFWDTLWDYLGLVGERGTAPALDSTRLPGARWFADAQLNYAENLLAPARHGRADATAIVALSEARARATWTYGQLVAEVGAFEAWLRDQGVVEGDRVVGVVAHTAEPIVAMLACASLGAIWASASPDFGIPGLIDRFAQIEPRVLVTVDAYIYGGKRFERLDRIEALTEAIDSITSVCVIDNTDTPAALPERADVTRWADIQHRHGGAAPTFSRGAFDRPVAILFSSGTTGTPKCIVHGAGGMLLQHGKEHVLHGDIGADDVFFYFTTCGWMMWNWQVGALATGTRLVTYDGNPAAPDLSALWAMAEREGVTHFGTSAKWLGVCRKAELAPGAAHDLSALRVVFSTGSPLLDADYDWFYETVGSQILLGSISGGTDIVSSFVGCVPSLPVRRGEIQARLLGADVAAFDDTGAPLATEKGELVCRKPLPSMPVAFWNDAEGARYRAAYFQRFPGVWAHGDIIRFTEHGGAIIYGRSDATLNVGGVRIGTAEIYRQIEPLADIADCLVAARASGDDDVMVMLVVMAEGAELDDARRAAIARHLKTQASPRHVPAHILSVAALPYTRSGKKVEIAVTRLLGGQTIDNTEALTNPETLSAIRSVLDEAGLLGVSS
ncbi:acetoacetate--CoA ligase [uncultured Salinisphaera sp.]|uniref:acetoacetate--CoA ligase n=1 Tax=uncultured Salinisphaera sp. TaxID=359372 RepID=UPI0032B12851|tara:strand:- start:79 stop:2070 length:1992 start_codon:yes stop_codon:yes gene_type:complete